MSEAFWFSGTSGYDVPADGVWRPIPLTGSGMTGDLSVATDGPDGLTLLVEAVARVKVWTEFASDGTGKEQIGVELVEAAGGAIRGQLQLLPKATMLAVAYDGWLAAGTIIRPAAVNSPSLSSDPRAPPANVMRIMPTSYATIVLTPTTQADSGGGDTTDGGGSGGGGGGTMGATAIPSTDGSVLISCEYNPEQFGPLGTTWAILNDNPLLGWFVDPDPGVMALPQIIGSLPSEPPMTGDVVSPFWAHVVGTVCFVPDTFRGTASDFFTFVATNNGAHRPIYAAFSNVTLATAWRGWKESNPDLALDAPPNVSPD